MSITRLISSFNNEFNINMWRMFINLVNKHVTRTMEFDKLFSWDTLKITHSLTEKYSNELKNAWHMFALERCLRKLS